MKPIPAGSRRRAGALLGADEYNALVEFAERMDVGMSWVARQAFKEFVKTHEAELHRNAAQLALDLKLR